MIETVVVATESSPYSACKMRISFHEMLCRLALFMLVSLVVTSLTGCKGSDDKPAVFIEDGTPAADKKSDFVTELADKFFREWLTGHGEADIVSDARGIGIKDNPTRLRAFNYVTNSSGEQVTVETEFRVTLPDGREIVEFLAGTGKTREEAVQTTFVNFTVSTFHVVYSCFINTADTHMTHEQIVINGKPWTLTSGGMMVMGGEGLPDFEKVSQKCREEVTRLNLNDDAHWLKFVYGRHKSEILATAVTLDNEEESQLTSRLQGLPWPETDHFYMAKQFMVLRPGTIEPGQAVTVSGKTHSDSAGN